MPEIRMPVGGTTPPVPPLNEVSIYIKSDKRLYIQDDSGAEVKLLTNEAALSSLAVQAPLLTSGGSSPTLSINAVTPLANGVMLATDKVKLNNSTINNTGNTLVQRDSAGSFSANEITANMFNGTATTVVTAPSLTGAVTSTGLNNLTTLGTGVVSNTHISNTANIALSKLAVNPLNRANHTGTQDANTLTNLDVEVEAYLSSSAPIDNDMISAGAAISLSKLAVNPLNRANHTGLQNAASISDFDVQVDNAINDYLVASPLTNTSISATADIDLSKLATNPLARANHTGSQLANTISNFGPSVAAAITTGNGISINTSGLLNLAGATDRISIGSTGIDIASNYVGQSSITTLGTISSGTWNGTIIPITYGGTGASSAGAASHRLNTLSVVTAASTTLNNSSSTVLADATAGAQTIILPLASTLYKYTIKKIDSSANNVVITPAAGNTIEGAPTFSLTAQYQKTTLISNGTTWYSV
jgi:hypothetical protein